MQFRMTGRRAVKKQTDGSAVTAYEAKDDGGHAVWMAEQNGQSRRALIWTRARFRQCFGDVAPANPLLQDWLREQNIERAWQEAWKFEMRQEPQAFKEYDEIVEAMAGAR